MNTVYLENYSQSPYGLEKLRFWEVEEYFICPVAGLCITPAEQIRILKKAEAWSKDKTGYELHGMIVESAKDENLLSRCVDYMLSIKFAKRAEALCRLDEKEFLKFAGDNVNACNYDLIIFVAATKKGLSGSCRQKVFGMIHIALFDNTGVLIEQVKTIEQFKSMRCEQNRKYKEQVKYLRNMRKEKDRLSGKS